MWCGNGWAWGSKVKDSRLKRYRRNWTKRRTQNWLEWIQLFFGGGTKEFLISVCISIRKNSTYSNRSGMKFKTLIVRVGLKKLKIHEENCRVIAKRNEWIFWFVWENRKSNLVILTCVRVKEFILFKLHNQSYSMSLWYNRMAKKKKRRKRKTYMADLTNLLNSYLILKA